MNVIFLDYDGVVNTPMWNEDGNKCRYNFPDDNKVNNFQAVQWISELCEKCDYSIVVTSTWKNDPNYKECLINGGLRPGIKILGKTERPAGTNRVDFSRGEEIEQYLKYHPEIEKYLIIDDEDDFTDEQKKHFIKTRHDVGFQKADFRKAVILS